ncbi:MAG: hypothetical protein KDD82_20720, partial [Planctomycetes bacterium]|nr:hypothetical protein [Planctomycetota bacterium]
FGFPPSVDRRQAFLGCFAGDALVVSTKTELQWWDGEGRVSQRERFVGGNAGTPEALLACDSGAILRGGDGPLRVWTPAAGAQTYPLLDVRALAGAGELVAYGLGDGTVGVLRLAGGALSPRGEAVALGEGGTRYVARLAWLGPTRLVALLRGLDLGDPESAAVQVVREGRAALALLRHDPATGALELVEEQRRGGAQSLAVLGAAPPTILLGTSLGNLLPLRVTASAEGEALTDVPGQSDRAFGTPVSCRDLAPIDATRALGAFDVRDLDPSGALPKQHAHLNGVLLYDLEQARAQGSAYRARVFVVSGYGPKRLIYDPGSEQVVVFSDVGGAYVYDLATLEEQAERE